MGSGDTRSGSAGPVYSHILVVLTASETTLREKKVPKGHTPSRPPTTSFFNAFSMNATHCFFMARDPHVQLPSSTGALL
jgi:hypothetical protein